VLQCCSQRCLLLLLLLLQAAAGGVTAESANLELMQSAVTAEVAKLAGKAGDGKATSEMERDMTDQMVRGKRGGAKQHVHVAAPQHCRRTYAA
jgi:hypothetical protein